MDRPIVVPLDGSLRAEKALAYATAMAKASGCPVHLVRVQFPPPNLGAGQVPKEVREQLNEQFSWRRNSAGRYLDNWSARVGGELGPDRVASTLLRDVTTVSGGLVELVRKLDAWSVVVGTRDRAPYARAGLFSVADGLLRRSGRPVLMVTDTLAEAGGWCPRRILLPLSPGERNEDLLLAAGRWSRRMSGRLVVATVVGSDEAPDRREQAERGLIRARRVFGAHLVSSTHVVDASSPSEGILRAAVEASADLVLMPTRRRGGAELLLRSITSEVIRRSPVPVMTFRRSRRSRLSGSGIAQDANRSDGSLLANTRWAPLTEEDRNIGNPTGVRP